MKRVFNPKVLMVGPTPPPAGGDSTWTLKYLSYYREHSYHIHHVNTAIIGVRSSLSNNRVSVVDEIRRCFGIWNGIIRESIKYRPNVIHMNSNCSTRGVYRDLISILLMKLSDAPVIFHCRCNVEYAIGNSKKRRYIIKLIMNLASAVFVQNRFSYDFVTGILAQKDDKVYLMPNYIESEKIVEEKKIREHVEKILYVGHISAAKGVGEILKCAKRYPKIEFNLVGIITDDYKDYKKIEKRLGNVHFGGNVDLETVQRFLDDADLFLLLSWSEGFSNALVEAMARGVPCIVSDVGANREMIENKGGIVCKVKDVDAMVAAIGENLDENVRNRESAWNIKKVHDEYTMDAVIQRIRNIYHNYVRESMR